MNKNEIRNHSTDEAIAAIFAPQQARELEELRAENKRLKAEVATLNTALRDRNDDEGSTE